MSDHPDLSAARHGALRVTAAMLGLEGVVLLASGSAYPRRLAARTRTRRVPSPIEGQRPWIDVLLRACGLAECCVAYLLLRRAPLRIEAFYDAWAGVYSRIGALWARIGYRDAFGAFRRALAPVNRTSSRVLDLGCGTGENLSLLRKIGVHPASYDGLDVSGRMLACAARRLASGVGIRLFQRNVVTDAWPRAEYDLILGTWLLEHIADIPALAAKARAHLAPQGRAVFVCEYHDGSVRVRSADALWRLFRARLPSLDELAGLAGVQSISLCPGVFTPTAVILLGAKERDEAQDS